jgi:hypothetical protein
MDLVVKLLMTQLTAKKESDALAKVLIQILEPLVVARPYLGDQNRPAVRAFIGWNRCLLRFPRLSSDGRERINFRFTCRAGHDLTRFPPGKADALLARSELSYLDN